MLIIKKINNNVALAEDAGDEIVVFGRGIGFPEMPYELEDESQIQRVFRSVDETVAGAAKSLSDEVLLAASDIAELARVVLDCSLSPNLPFILGDHLQFSLNREEGAPVAANPLQFEVAYVYPREHEVGLKGLKIVEDRCGVELPESEATSIALHIVNAEIDGMGRSQDLHFVMKSTAAIQAVTEIVEEQMGKPIDRSGYAYVRFVTHLRFLVRRLIGGGLKATENSSLFRQASRDFPEAYRCAAAIDTYFREEHGWSCSNEELLYLMMHINRLESGGPKRD